MDIETPRRPIVNEDSRYHRAVQAVWERSYLQWEQWSLAKREAVQPALVALASWLTNSNSETDLVTRYMDVGDAPGDVLRPLLPTALPEEDLLILEEAAFCMRLFALRRAG